MTELTTEFWFPPAGQLGWFAPELALIATIVAVVAVPIILGRRARLSACVALLGVVAALLLTGDVGRRVAEEAAAGLAPPGAPPMLIADNFAVFFKAFLLLFLTLVTVLWLFGLTGRRPALARRFAAHSVEFFVLLLGSALGMMVMVSTLNLLMIILAIELASLPSYALAGYDKRDPAGAEASLKYVLFGAVTAAITLYGVSLLYGAFGTLDIPTIAAAMAGGGAGVGAALGLLGLCVGIGFKISAVPFHFWCPDVFEGATIEVATWLSVASKAAGLGLLLRVVTAMGSLDDALAITVGIVATATCTLANFAAYRQQNVKRILAYSSIAHAGYMLMAAAVFVPAASEAEPNLAASALLLYLLTYLFMNFGVFAATACVEWETGSSALSNFIGLGRRAPWLAVPMAVCLLSLVGLPPLGGFLAKWWLLVALGSGAAEHDRLWGLVLVLVLNTLFSLYYYLRIIYMMFLRTEWSRPAPLAPHVGGLVLVNACAVVLLLFGTLGARAVKLLADEYAVHLYAAPLARAAAALVP